MRLLCCGDPHIGAGAAYGPRPGDRIDDQARVLKRIVDLAVEEQVDGVLFAGDAFERRSPTPSEMMVWRAFVEALSDEGLDLLACAGNHDVSAAEAPTAMEVVSSRGYYDPMRQPGTSYAWDGVAVAVLPWTPPARLVASQGGGDRDELNAQVADLLIETARGLREQIPEGRTSILLGHWSVSGASTPTGMDVGLFREPVLPLSEVIDLGFDAVILAHIHRRQILSENPLVMYVGSPSVCNFSEAKDDHGVEILEFAT